MYLSIIRVKYQLVLYWIYNVVRSKITKVKKLWIQHCGAVVFKSDTIHFFKSGIFYWTLIHLRSNYVINLKSWKPLITQVYVIIDILTSTSIRHNWHTYYNKYTSYLLSCINIYVFMTFLPWLALKYMIFCFEYSKQYVFMTFLP